MNCRKPVAEAHRTLTRRLYLPIALIVLLVASSAAARNRKEKIEGTRIIAGRSSRRPSGSRSKAGLACSTSRRAFGGSGPNGQRWSSPASEVAWVSG